MRRLIVIRLALVALIAYEVLVTAFPSPEVIGGAAMGLAACQVFEEWAEARALERDTVPTVDLREAS